MQLPSMRYADKFGKGTQVKFRGLKHRLGANDGELWDMENMTGDHYPLLSTRSKRRKYKTLVNPGGLFCLDGLCWVEDSKFYFNGELKGLLSSGLKRFAAIGKYILILPDKKYYNTETGLFGSIESAWEGATLSFGNGKLFGEDADANMIYYPDAPWGDLFRVGDGVTISGCTLHPENNQTAIIREIDGDKLYFYENIFVLDEGGAGYTEVGDLRIGRDAPDLTYALENENRLWGCTDSTIYASKLGDIFNWSVFDGLASDSWAVDSGSAGKITGCIAYRGYPTFLKEEHVYKMYGTLPSNFEMMGSASLGLMEGSADSMAIAGETLFYLGRSGILAYTGGVPQSVSKDFGTLKFRNAVGGSDGLKYYVSMQGEDDVFWLYVYDTQTGLWHKEDQTRATHFASYQGVLYMLNDKGEIWAMGEPADIATDPEPDFNWFVEFADFTEQDPNKKTIGRLQVRLELDPGATAQVWIRYDSAGDWLPAGEPLAADVKRSYTLPLVPKRCDHCRIKITGTGDARIYSLTREFYTGSEIKSRPGRS